MRLWQSRPKTRRRLLLYRVCILSYLASCSVGYMLCFSVSCFLSLLVFYDRMLTVCSHWRNKRWWFVYIVGTHCSLMVCIRYSYIWYTDEETAWGWVLSCLSSLKGSRALATIYKVTTFLEFLETWKCQGIRLRSGKSQGKCPKLGKGQGICVVRKFDCGSSTKNLPVLYSYCKL